jgi:uncharacterized damage-inducible protein DinB
MSELEQVLIGDSAAAPPSHILEGLSDELAHRAIDGVPHTIYQELWHIAFWQQITLDWVRGIETPFPAKPSDGLATQADIDKESWDGLCRRFFQTSQEAAAAARDEARLDHKIVCPSRPGEPARTMTVREQLESLGAHNAYHFGRIVVLRQLFGAWPPKSGGFSW